MKKIICLIAFLLVGFSAFADEQGEYGGFSFSIFFMNSYENKEDFQKESKTSYIEISEKATDTLIFNENYYQLNEKENEALSAALDLYNVKTNEAYLTTIICEDYVLLVYTYIEKNQNLTYAYKGIWKNTDITGEYNDVYYKVKVFGIYSSVEKMKIAMMEDYKESSKNLEEGSPFKEYHKMTKREENTLMYALNTYDLSEGKSFTFVLNDYEKDYFILGYAYAGEDNITTWTFYTTKKDDE